MYSSAGLAVEVLIDKEGSERKRDLFTEVNSLESGWSIDPNTTAILAKNRARSLCTLFYQLKNPQTV